MIQIELPWFPRACSPNARSRSHWPKTNAMKKTRSWAYNATLAAAGSVWTRAGRVPLRITFYPPAKRNHDDDNLIASVKGYRDGIAQALGIDDNLFDISKPNIGEPVKGGKIVVVLG